MTTRRLLQFAAIGGGLILVLGIAVAAFASMKVPFTPPTVVASSAPCAPQPCANVRGFQLWVSALNVQDGVVSMKLTFKNSSNSTHADPADIQLIDSTGRPNPRVTGGTGCTAWPRTEFAHGAQFGPVDECFHPSNTNPPMRLHWEPDFGPFCCETQIPLAT